MSQKKIIVGAVGVVLVGVAALVYASPYMALHAIKKAIDAQDTSALSEYVDYPVLRENIKVKMMASITKAGRDADSNGASQDSPASAFGSMIGQALGAPLVNIAVDNLVTPSGILAMIAWGRSPLGNMGRKEGDVQAPPSTSQEPGAQDQGPRLGLNYQGFSKIRVYNERSPGKGFIFRRDGLMGWKLINIDM